MSFNIMQTAAAALAQQMKAVASIPAVYRRGVESVSVRVWLGRKLLKLDDGQGGFRIEWTDIDVMMCAADLHFDDDVPLEPMRGDLLDLTYGSETQTFEAFPFGNEPLWRWSDPYQTILRIHFKHVDTNQFYS